MKKILTSSLSSVGGAYSRALKAEKSKSQPFPVGGGTNGYKRLVHNWHVVHILRAVNGNLVLHNSPYLAANRRH